MFSVIDYVYVRKSGAASDFRLTVPRFCLRSGEVVYLSGLSGAGKTTILDLLAGIIDSPIKHACRQVFPTIGYVMHNATLLPWLSVRQNINVEARLRKAKVNYGVFVDYCERMLLCNVLGTYPTELSLGMRQRVELAKALSFNPSLLLLDEAMSGIDAKTNKVIAAILFEAVSGGLTVVATSHQATDVLRLAYRVYFIRSGTVLEAEGISVPVADRIGMSPRDLSRLPWAEGFGQEAHGEITDSIQRIISAANSKCR